VNGTFDVTPRLGAKKKSRQRFLVEKILPASEDKDTIVPYQFSWDCRVIIRDMQPTPNATLPASPLALDFETLKGMNKELEKLARILQSEELQEPILIVGPPGTGKTSVLGALSTLRNWATFPITASTISSSDSRIRASLSATFSEARSNLPSMILIDDLDDLVPRDAPSAFASALGNEIRNDLNRNVRIVASAKRQLNLHQNFTWTFLYIVEFPVPTAAARKEILKLHCKSASDELLERVSLRTHAFVPGDIWRLCGAARLAADARAQQASMPSTDSRPKRQVLEEDFEVALRSVRPSAMGEILLDVPNVRWSDIGGSEHLKEELQRATSFIFGVSDSCSVLRLLIKGRLLWKVHRSLNTSQTAGF
jgi:SpoVK/Ycf46/Vps4 family AAA+-type ATPase